MLVNGAQKFSSFRFDGHEAPGSTGSLEQIPVNFSGVTGQNDQLSQFTIGGRLRVSGVNGPQTPVITMTGSEAASGPAGNPLPTTFRMYLEQNGELFAGFPGGAGVRSHIQVNDNLWHSVAVSFQGTPDNQNTVMGLFLDGVLLDQVEGPTDGLKYFPYTFGYPGLDYSTPVDFSNLAIWDKAVATDYMDMPEWFAPEGPAGQGGLATYFDFSGGQIGTMGAAGMAFTPWSGNRGPTVPSSKLDWNISCAAIPPACALSMPIESPFLETSPGAPFTFMGWMGVPASTGSATFIRSGSLHIWMHYDDAAQKVIIEYDNAAGNRSRSTATPASAADLHWIALSSDGTTLKVYVDGEPFVTDDLTQMPTTIQADAVFGANDTDQPINLQNFSLFSQAMTAEQMAEKAHTNDPFGDADCMAWLQLTGNLADSKTGSSLIAKGGTPAFAEIKIPVPADWQPSANAMAQHRKRQRDAEGSVTAMRFKDYIALAQSKGIDTSAPPSSRLRSEPQFQTSVAWYGQALDVSGLDPALQARLKASFEKNLAIGLELSQSAPGAGRVHIRERNGTSILTYHDGVQHHELLDLSEHGHDLRSDVTGTQLAKLFTDVLVLILAALGAVVAVGGIAKAFQRSAGLLATVVNELTPILATVQTEMPTFNQAMMNAMWKILQLVHGLGLLGTAIWNGITANWWSFGWTVASLLLQIIGFILSFFTGGAAAIGLLLIRISQMAVAIYAIIEDIADIQSNPAPLPQN